MRLAPLSIAAGILAISAAAFASYDLSWHKISAGGETLSTGGNYELGGTIGQHDAGSMIGCTYEMTGGFWAVATSPAIPGDVTGTGSVNVDDLLVVLNNWGPCVDCCKCPADANSDCEVNVDDLLIILNNWG